MLSTSNSLVALAKKMAKPETKTVTRTISIPQTKVVKQPQQQSPNNHQQTKISQMMTHMQQHLPVFVLNRRYQINETSKLLWLNLSKLKCL